MKIYNSPGTEARLREMMKGVTGTNIKKKIGKKPKKKLNENFQQGTPETAQMLDTAYEKLKTGALSTEQGGSSKSSSQSMNDVTYVGINGFDSEKNMYNFNFKVTGSEGDQGGVMNIDDVVLEKFYYQNSQGEKVLDLNEKDLVEFNNQHGSDLYQTIQEYITVDVNPGDEMAELQEAVLDWSIDMSDPFGGARQEYQDGPGYGDEKPVNPKLRVKAPELDSFVQENEEMGNEEVAVIQIGGYQYHLKKHGDSTHFYLSSNPNAIANDHVIVSHIGQHAGEEYYDDVRAWLKGGPSPEGKEYQSTQGSIREGGDEEEVKEPEGWSDVDGSFKDAGGVMKWSEKEEEPTEEPEVPEEKPEDAPEEEVPTGDVEHLEGGLADGADMEEFDPKQILMGMEVEMEHTDDPSVALEITMDHLKEIPDYYTHLDKMEKEAGAGEEIDTAQTMEPGFGAPQGMGNEFKDEIDSLKAADNELKNNILGYNTETPNASEEDEQ